MLFGMDWGATDKLEIWIDNEVELKADGTVKMPDPCSAALLCLRESAV